MPSITFDNQLYQLEPNETVLDGLLRHGLEIPHGCKAGSCHSCMMHLEEGEIAESAQSSLKEQHKALGYFLSCSCIPAQDLTVALASKVYPRVQAEVLEVNSLSAEVLRIRCTATFEFRAGQYLNIWQDEFTVRSYSIASVRATDNCIELHVKVIPGGRFSQWAATHLKAGDELTLQGPMGDCFYAPTNPSQPLLLVGIGTGLAPLYGIMKEALHRGHQGPMHLVVGARSSTGFYLEDELIGLTENAQIKVDFVSLDNFDEQAPRDIYQFIRQQYPSTKEMGIYLCGAASFVRKMKRQCFLAGANMRDIHADAFLPCS